MSRRPILTMAAIAAFSGSLTGCFGHHNVTGPNPAPQSATIVDNAPIAPMSTQETTVPDLTGEQTCNQ